jgi:hypothetical protein
MSKRGRFYLGASLAFLVAFLIVVFYGLSGACRP